jgi:hypothetical protein
MDLIQLIEYRRHIGIAVVCALLAGWYVYGYRPRTERLAELEAQSQLLNEERAKVVAQIERERAQPMRTESLPSRVAPAAAASLSPVDRLNYFLGNITKPANDLELSYFTVTPQPPTMGPGYQEIPFTISVGGSYSSLADFLYQLEYGQDFIVRDLGMMVKDPKDGAVQADFRLSALLLNDPNAKPGPKTSKDPGTPTSLELARDPFGRPTAKVAVASDGKPYFLNVPAGLRLSGIMSTGGRNVAIINHEPFPVGASIENKTITKISDRGVELSDKVRAYFLEMEQPPVTTAARAKEASAR